MSRRRSAEPAAGHRQAIFDFADFPDLSDAGATAPDHAAMTTPTAKPSTNPKPKSPTPPFFEPSPTDLLERPA